MLKKILSFLLILISCIEVKAQDNNQVNRFEVSLITCYPGQIVYELYGHTAIRIKHGQTDKVYNFGLFSFNKPNFIYRFVKGETDYALGGYPFYRFAPEYIDRNSKIVEQVLNLSQEQAESLFLELEYLSLPENREYRYNYVLDNCATRPRDMIEKAVGGISYPIPQDTTLTFRDMMRSYSQNYPWYQMGIDLALGSGIDYTLTTREQMFAPIYLMNAFGKATFKDADGKERILVSKTNILFDGSESPVLPPTPWYLSPLFVSLLTLMLFGFITYKDVKTRKVTKWIDFVWFALCGLIGCLLFFLIFISSHEATSPNYLAIWLNPLCFIASIFVYIKSCKNLLYIYHFINFAVVLILLIFWWALPQEANLAFFLLMLCSIIRSANYIYINKACVKRNK